MGEEGNLTTKKGMTANVNDTKLGLHYYDLEEDTSFHEENKDALLLNQDYHMAPDKELMSFQEKEVQHEKQKNDRGVMEETEIDNEEGHDLDMDRYLLSS